jgi:polyhydroxybutyrate depolymerase
LYRPASVARPSGALPAVVVLHGGFGTGRQAEGAYGWDARADAHGFLVAYPDGLSRAWNAGTCCGDPQRRGIDDVGFLGGLLEALVADEGVDPDRIYMTGMSNGAMMAYRMACELPGRLAAIGPVAGTMVVDCDSAAPVSVLHVHGLDDHNVPFAGGVGTKSVAKDHRPSVPSVIERWRVVNACASPLTTQQGPVRTERAAGAGGTTVTLVTVAGAGHQWPGARPPGPVAQRLLQLDPPSTALDATALLWDFFASHRRPSPG